MSRVRETPRLPDMRTIVARFAEPELEPTDASWPR
jgi:hypothetical protein